VSFWIDETALAANIARAERHQQASLASEQ
jgi:hypothetical protein